MQLILEYEAWQVIKNDAEQTYPHECCGFMYGTENDEQRTITLAKEVNNSREENRERRFEISPQDYIRAEQFAEENDLILLGVYHSHPEHPAIPSEHDLKRALPYFSYIITSVKKSQAVDVRSWRLDDDGRFGEEAVKIEAEELNIDKFLN